MAYFDVILEKPLFFSLNYGLILKIRSIGPGFATDSKSKLSRFCQ
jgi:hypothetical protein